MTRRVFGAADELRALLRRARRPADRARLNDRWQRARAQARPGQRRGSAPTPPGAQWRSRPRPRVTGLPTNYRPESEKARARQRRRELVAEQLRTTALEWQHRML